MVDALLKYRRALMVTTLEGDAMYKQNQAVAVADASAFVDVL